MKKEELLRELTECRQRLVELSSELAQLEEVDPDEVDELYVQDLREEEFNIEERAAEIEEELRKCYANEIKEPHPPLANPEE
jgi:hypothetical protein